MGGFKFPFLILDCSVFNVAIKQTPIGDKYIINSTLNKPKTENISGVIMVSLREPKLSYKTTSFSKTPQKEIQ